MAKTIRFCKICNQNRYFAFSKKIGHSSCSFCGNRFASKNKSGDLLKEIDRREHELSCLLVQDVNKERIKGGIRELIRLKKYARTHCLYENG